MAPVSVVPCRSSSLISGALSAGVAADCARARLGWMNKIAAIVETIESQCMASTPAISSSSLFASHAKLRWSRAPQTFHWSSPHQLHSIAAKTEGIQYRRSELGLEALTQKGAK